MLDKNEVMAMLNCPMDNNMNIKNDSLALYKSNDIGDTIGYKENHADLSGWSYFTDYYYPNVIRESYPVYIQERTKDKGKQAFEIIKVLKDKKMVSLKKVGDFIDLMDELIKIL